MFYFRYSPLLLAAGLCLAFFPGCCVFKTSAYVKAHTKVKAVPKATVSNGVELTARLDPAVVKLSDARRATVVLSLKNHSSRFVRLDFPTSQRIEVLVLDPKGHQIVQWSEDQAFENVPASVGINPGEHLEYRAVIGTRDFVVNQPHTVVATVVGYPKLKMEIPVTPKP